MPVYPFWGAVAGAMGEVVGEAWAGALLHQLGHAIGTMLLICALVAAAWFVLRRRVAGAARWAVAGAVGSVVGLLLYLPVLSFAPATAEELTIALSLYLPLTAPVVAQARVLRGHVRGARRWAAAWFVAIVLGVAIAWYVGGGLAGAAAGWPHPVLEKAVACWWRVSHGTCSEASRSGRGRRWRFRSPTGRPGNVPVTTVGHGRTCRRPWRGTRFTA